MPREKHSKRQNAQELRFRPSSNEKIRMAISIAADVMGPSKLPFCSHQNGWNLWKIIPPFNVIVCDSCGAATMKYHEMLNPYRFAPSCAVAQIAQSSYCWHLGYLGCTACDALNAITTIRVNAIYARKTSHLYSQYLLSQ